MHVIIDGYGGDPDQLADENVVRVILDRYPDEMGMTKITQPSVVRFKGTKPEDWGISGYVMIAESHIAIHTFPDRGYVWVDIFSCKEFETEGAVDRVADAFGLTHVKTDVHERGLEYPHSMMEARPVAMGERFAVAGAFSESPVGG